MGFFIGFPKLLILMFHRWNRFNPLSIFASLNDSKKRHSDVCTCHNSGAKEQSSMGQCIIWNKWGRKDLITLYTLSLHILLTVLYTFLQVLSRRICFTINSFLSWWSFHLFSWHWWVIQGWHCKEKLGASQSFGSNC